MRIDLHLHSDASDGAMAPAAVVDAAVAGGLDLIALADHDTVAGVAPASEAATGRLHVLPAIEVSTTHGPADLHILGYNVDIADQRLNAYVQTARDRREERVVSMIGLLDDLGLPLELDDVWNAAGHASALARPHLARAMLERGLVGSISEAFDRYIGDGGPAFLPTRLPPPAEAIDLIHSAGGIAVWAHPPLDGLEGLVERFARDGLDGLECHRPRLNRAEIRRISRAARRNDLLITGGSDWHGPWNGELGSFFLEPADVEAFLERAGI